MSLAPETSFALSGGTCRLASASYSYIGSARYYLPPFRRPACTLVLRPRPSSSLALGQTRSACLVALGRSGRGASGAGSCTGGAPSLVAAGSATFLN